MSVPVTIKVKKEVVELADEMVKHGLAKSRSSAFNIIIERGLQSAMEELEYWKGIRERVDEIKRKGIRIARGDLTGLLEEERSGQR